MQIRRSFFVSFICSLKFFTLSFVMLMVLYIFINIPLIDELFEGTTGYRDQQHQRSAIIPGIEGPIPIDAVYTWVNGSDPDWIDQLSRVTNQLLIDQISPSCDRIVQIIFNCIHSNCCHPLPLMVIRPPMIDPKKYLKGIRMEFFNKNFTLIHFSDLNFVKEYESNCVRVLDGKVYKFSPLLLIEEKNKNSTDDGKEKYDGPTGPIFSFESLIKLQGNAFNVDIDEFGNFSSTIKHQHQQQPSLMELKQNEKTNRIFLSINTDVIEIRGLNKQWNVNDSLVNLGIADPEFFQHNLDGNENYGKNRFYDNDELRYSLRSLDRYAPWIRKIFIVTNGQIPRWLNLEHPKIRIIKHEDIFTNHSHLPTFSSNAIESHIHRIENLSKYFLYFNDDVILGKPIYPDDFFTKSRGFRVYLSWPVPNCAAGCPLTWLNDGFCDKACNSSKCLWDGGDCVNETIIARQARTNSQSSNHQSVIGHHSSFSSNTGHCSPNCLDLWLGDSSCDRVCNNSQCAFDMADCGVEKFSDELPSILVLPNRFTYSYPENVSIVYLNFSLFHHYPYGDGIARITIVDGTFLNESESIQSAVLNEEHQVLTLLFKTNIKKENLILNLTAMFQKKMFHFKIFLIVNDTEDFKVSKFHRHVNLSSIIASLSNNNNNDDPSRPGNISGPTSPQMFAVYSGQAESSACEIDFKDIPEPLRHKLKSINVLAKNSNDDKNENFYGQLEMLYRNLICDSNAKLNENGKKFQQKNKESNYYSLERYFYEKNSFRSRKLLDAYADSLIYVNYLYNKEFGIEVRKVPAHMAHFIDRDIMFRLQDRYNAEYQQTSSQKIRTSTDMQLAFSYYYFMMSEMEQLSFEDIFASFDLDHSGDLDRNELKTLALNIYKTPGIPKDFEDQLNECCPWCQMNATRFRPVTISIFSYCTKLKEKILQDLGKRRANQFETCNDDDVAFKMLRSNETLLEMELNRLRIERKKFICLNDNFDHDESDDERLRLKTILEEFYLSLVPKKSPFELDVPNQFGHIDQYRQWKRQIRDHSLVYQQFSYLFAFLNISFIIIIILYVLK